MLFMCVCIITLICDNGEDKSVRERNEFCNIGEKAYLVYGRIVYECTYIHACQYVRICNVFLTNINLTMYVPSTISFKLPKFYKQLYTQL